MTELKKCEYKNHKPIRLDTILKLTEENDSVSYERGYAQKNMYSVKQVAYA